MGCQFEEHSFDFWQPQETCCFSETSKPTGGPISLLFSGYRKHFCRCRTAVGLSRPLNKAASCLSHRITLFILVVVFDDSKRFVVKWSTNTAACTPLKIWPLLPSSAGCKSYWNWTFTFPYSFTACTATTLSFILNTFEEITYWGAL